MHEAVHRQTIMEGIAKYGDHTPAFNKWYTDPKRWAADEIKAYSADIKYMENVLPQIK